MLGHESNTRSKIHRNDDTANGKYTSVNLKSTHITRNIPIKSISSNVSVARKRINIASNTTNPNNVSATPCDSLPKPSHGNESQTFQRFHDKGHVFSAHYDYRENAIQVSFHSFPIINRGWHNEEWTNGCHLLKESLYFDSSSIEVGKGHISNTCSQWWYFFIIFEYILHISTPHIMIFCFPLPYFPLSTSALFFA